MDTLQWFKQVNQEIERTDGRYASLYRQGLKVWPIPVFGRLEEAEILTVGVNPSCGEFYGDRWLDVETAEQQVQRLIGYFDNQPFPAHPWFSGWERALNHLDASYRQGNKYLAAHIDLSPRATIPMGQVDPMLFLDMVREDLQHCVAALNRAKKLKLWMMAGCVTGRYYINEFLRESLPSLGARLEGEFRRVDHPGKGKVCFHQICYQGCSVPAFFCSSSPSSGKDLLASRVRAKRDKLKGALEAPVGPNG